MTGVLPGPVTVKVAEVIVNGFIASLNVAATVLLMGTLVWRLVGLMEVTVGAVVFATVPVVNVETKLLANGFPAKSLAPVVIVMVYVVLEARLLDGVKVTVSLAAS